MVRGSKEKNVITPYILNVSPKTGNVECYTINAQNVIEILGNIGRNDER